MRLARVAAIALAFLLLSAVGAGAGEITSCLSSGTRGCEGGTLKNVPFKSVVLEFLDPRQSGIGESVSRLLWRDLLFAIRDMRGRGVILGKDFEGAVRDKYGKTPSDLLDQRFHGAAVEIGRFLEAQMTVWGAVVTGESSVTIYSFLTILPDHWRVNLGLSLIDPRRGSTGIVAPLSQTSFNFAPIFTDRRALFAGPMRVRCALSAGCPKGIPTYREPADDAPIAQYFPEGATVEVRDMSGKWMTIAAEGGGVGYMNIYHADVAPRAIVARNLLRVAVHPVAGATESFGTVSLDGRYDVLAMARVGQDLPWYKITTSRGPGWIAGSLVEPLYRFPLTHFLAGLYRYEAGDFGRAEQEFSHYLEAVGNAGDRISRSLALQLLAAGRAQARRFDVSATSNVLGPLAEAGKLTPFDPAIYTMEALIKMTGQRRLAAAVPDLTRAVELDRESPATAAFLTALTRAIEEPPNSLQSLGIEVSGASRRQVLDLRAAMRAP